MRAAASTFGSIPIGETTMDLEADSLKMPEKLNINYDEQITSTKTGEQREFKQGDANKNKSLLDDDEDETPKQVVQPIAQPVKQPFQQPVQQTNDPFLDILGLSIDGSSGPATTVAHNKGGGDLLGGFSFEGQSQPVKTQPVNQSKGFDSLMDDGLLGGGSSVQPSPFFTQPQGQQPNSLGFDFLGTGSTPVNQPAQFNQFQQPQQQNNVFKFKAYETPHV